MGVDCEIEAGGGSSSSAPGGEVADEVGADCDHGMSRGVKEFGERKEGTGREDRDDEDGGDNAGKPAGAEEGKEQEEELVACNCGPVERGVDVVGGRTPMGGGWNGIDKDGDAGAENKLFLGFGREARPSQSQKNESSGQKCKSGKGEREHESRLRVLAILWGGMFWVTAVSSRLPGDSGREGAVSPPPFPPHSMYVRQRRGD